MIQLHSTSRSCGLLVVVGPGLSYYPNGEAKNNIFCLAIWVVWKAQCMHIVQKMHNISCNCGLLEVVGPGLLYHPNGEAKIF